MTSVSKHCVTLSFDFMSFQSFYSNLTSSLLRVRLFFNFLKSFFLDQTQFVWKTFIRFTCSFIVCAGSSKRYRNMCLVHMAISTLGLQEVSTVLVSVNMLTKCSLNSHCLLKGKIIIICSDIYLFKTTHLHVIASWRLDKWTLSTNYLKATKQLFYTRTLDIFLLRTVFLPTRLTVYSFKIR